MFILGFRNVHVIFLLINKIMLLFQENLKYFIYLLQQLIC